MSATPAFVLLDDAPDWDTGSATGWQVRRVTTPEDARAALKSDDVRAVVARVGETSDLSSSFVRQLHAAHPDVPIVLVAEKAPIAQVTDLMRAGAFDCLLEPLHADDLREALERAQAFHSLGEAMKGIGSEDQISAVLDVHLGETPPMRQLFALVRKVAPLRATVLVMGETGSGKEVVARSIHFLSPRAQAPFVALNVAALPSELVEAELFGHERGAFTGAHKARRGAFERASGGTLFLDEIGDLPLAAQPKLLRVLDEHCVRPLGADRATDVDVRLIAATHRNLAEDRATGRFREDLYFRINVIPLRIPPLRDHKQDVRPLADFFVRKHASRPGRSISEEALERLTFCRWRGNVRELENAIERALALSDHDRLTASDFDFLELEARPIIADSLLPGAVQQQLPLRQLEDIYLHEILELKHGDRAEAARVLGIDRRTLSRRLANAS